MIEFIIVHLTISNVISFLIGCFTIALPWAIFAVLKEDKKKYYDYIRDEYF
jgi:hypothetical protein